MGKQFKSGNAEISAAKQTFMRNWKEKGLASTLEIPGRHIRVCSFAQQQSH